MTMSPRERYQNDLVQHGFQPDASQAEAIEQLQDLYLALIALEQRSGIVRLWDRWVKGSNTAPRGLYFWGGVGRGKTYLMDIFYESLPLEHKLRTHFHRFMRRVHQEMKQVKDLPDPLEHVASRIARDARVLCFDEFFVADIADAMILGNLLKALFARGVVLVATSNIEPQGLYKDGLQRARFLPAIDLLLMYTQTVNVDGGTDYRLRTLERAKLYHTPANEAANASLEAFFLSLVPDHNAACRAVDIEVDGRTIHAVKEAEDVVWFDFIAICDGPRSQNDYIEIAREYHAVVISHVPVFDGSNDDQARRFIYLVDEFYDRHVKLILSAEKPIAELYAAGRLRFEFERTISRILEMQSQEYLAKAHRP